MKHCYELLSSVRRNSAGVFLVLAMLLGHSARAQEVVISEILAANQSIAPVADFPDYTPDYVELYNATDAEINLADGGWTLSNKKNPSPLDFKDHFFFPQGTTIPPFGYLLVFFDNDTTVPGIHTTFTRNGTNVTFTLDRNGDQVQLYKDFRLTKVDSIFFGIQVTDLAVGRIPSGDTNQTFLVKPSPGQPNEVVPLGSPATLKINEWVALDTSGTGRSTNDWFEVYNPDTNAVLLTGLVWADKNSRVDVPNPNQRPAVVANSYIAPQGFVQIFCNGGNNPDEVDFSLSSSTGDEIYIFASDRTTIIDQVIFGALTTPNVSRGRVPDGGDEIIQFNNPTPLDSNFGPIPEILITEVLPHTDLPLEDAIELFNPTGSAVDISGWWLSNQEHDPKKFQIPPGTIVPAHGYKVFYEFVGLPGGFNPSGLGTNRSFTLNSSDGDQLWLFKAKADGSLLGFRRGIDFPPSENGVSFGRYVNSQTNVDIVPMSDLSFGTSVRAGQAPSLVNTFRTGTGAPNPYPLVGPIVINEIHYRPPPDISGGQTNDNSRVEFVELRNVTAAPAPLYLVDVNHPDYATNFWKIRGDIEFDFPLNQAIPAKGYALVVNFDPDTNATQLAEFKALFPDIPANVKIYGPYKNKLRNGGGTVELKKPDSPQIPDRGGFTPYVLVDRIKYDDEAPWPLSPDGTGDSLQRLQPTEYGNDPINWKGAPPTPGRPNGPMNLTAPTLTTAPVNQTVTVGSTATLTAAGSGQMLAYRWQFNNAVLADETNATLRIPNVTLAHAGAYRVRVSNPAGDVLSGAAILTVRTTAADTTRPTLTVTNPPPANAEVTSPVVLLGGTASDNVGVTKVEYQLNGGAYADATGLNAWIATLNLTPGTNIVRVRAWDEAGNISVTNTRSLFYAVSAPFSITLAGDGTGTVAGPTNGQLLVLGRSYTLTATPAAGSLFSHWDGDTNGTLPKLTFVMQEFFGLTATFVKNPFIPTKGTYNGLFYEESGAQHASSGFFTLNLTDRGSFTASLQNAGKRYSARGNFDLAGHATSTISRLGTSPLQVVWNLSLDGSNRVEGSVSDGTWTAKLSGDRAVWNSRSNQPPIAGRKYTFVIPGNTNSAPESAASPVGNGFGTASVDAGGVVSLRGNLADGTAISQRVALSKDLDWPLYLSLYGGKGSLIGWLKFQTLESSDVASERVSWIKPPLATSKYYPMGFNIETTLTGSLYTPPVGTTNRVLNLTSGMLTFTDGNLPGTLVNNFALLPGSKVTNGGPATKLTLTFTLPSGLFNGSMTPTGTTRAISFKGAVLQTTTNGSGFFLGTNQSGRVSLEAQP